MKKVMEKVIFMAVGSFLTIIGYHFGTVDNNSADAEINIDAAPVLTDGEFNKIRCRNLEIVDADGNTRILLARDLFENGFISIPNKDGESAVVLGNHGGGYISVTNADNKSSTTLHTTAYGGQVSIFNKTGEVVLQTGVTENGVGQLKTWDKFGDEKGEISPLGKYRYLKLSMPISPITSSEELLEMLNENTVAPTNPVKP